MTIRWQFAMICHIGHHFQAICCQNVQDLDYDLENGSRSNVNMPIESPYMTISKIFIVKMCMTFILTYRMGQGQLLVCQSKGRSWRAIWWQLSLSPYISLFLRNSLSKCVWPWPWPSEWIKCEHVNLKAIHNLLFKGDRNFYHNLSLFPRCSQYKMCMYLILTFRRS